MKSRLTPHLIDLVYNSALKSFWRKKALYRFLAGCDVPKSLILSDPDSSKREILDYLFEKVVSVSNREGIIAKMAYNLKEQTTFPDLEGWEDSTLKKEAAVKAVNELRIYINEQDKEIDSEKDAIKARKLHSQSLAQSRKSRETFDVLNQRLTELTKEIGTQTAGFSFEKWFFDLMDFYEVKTRRPYRAEGRQIDGAITLQDTTYLVELKFKKEPIGPDSIDSFMRKVTTKADNTMGVIISMSGYTPVAIKEASGNKTPLLLFDYSHVYQALTGIMSFPDIIDRVRRHASQTGEAFLSTNSFSG